MPETMPDTLPKILWSPSQLKQNDKTPHLDEFAARLRDKYDLDFKRDYAALHRWSVENTATFWNEIWDFCGVIGDKGGASFEPTGQPPYGRFFSDSKISYAENMLRYVDLLKAQPAIIVRHEGEAGNEVLTTYGALYDMVSVFEQALRDADVREGDCVAAYLPNIAQTDALLLAASNIGAIFVSTDMDTGEQSLLDRFGDIRPKILFAGDGYRFKGKEFLRAAVIGSLQDKISSIQKTVVVPTIHYDAPARMDGFNTEKSVSLADFIASFKAKEIEFIRRDFNHPLFMLFSSGSTGKPKRFVHSSGGILIEMMCERMLHNDIHIGDVDFQHSKTTWMMWNFQNAALSCGATLLKQTGDNFSPDLESQWDFVAKHKVTHFGSAAPLLIKWMDAGLELGETYDLSALRFISSTGSVLPESAFHYIHDKISPKTKIVSFSGGSDKCACCVGGNVWTETRAGYIDGPTLGHDIRILEESGKDAAIGTQGELCFMNPTPSCPLWFHGDDESFAQYKEAYYEDFAGILEKPVWRHGDLTEATSTRGFVIHGRSDTTLNQYGVRFGTHMIYQQLKQFGNAIKGATAVNYTVPTDKQQIAVLLLDIDNYADGVPEDLEKKIRTSIRNNEGPNYVPAHIIAVPGTLTTLSGKNAEKVAAKALGGADIGNPNDYGANGAKLIAYLQDAGKALDAHYNQRSEERFKFTG